MNSPSPPGLPDAVGRHRPRRERQKGRERGSDEDEQVSVLKKERQDHRDQRAERQHDEERRPVARADPATRSSTFSARFFRPPEAQQRLAAEVLKNSRSSRR
jgi:hypothetical protein